MFYLHVFNVSTIIQGMMSFYEIRQIMHPRHPGMHIANDSLLLILSFELNFFVYRHVFIWGFQNRVCLSILREKKSPYSFINISPPLVIDTSMESLHEYYNMETQKFEFISLKKKFEIEFRPFLRCWRAEITLASWLSVLH